MPVTLKMRLGWDEDPQCADLGAPRRGCRRPDDHRPWPHPLPILQRRRHWTAVRDGQGSRANSGCGQRRPAVVEAASPRCSKSGRRWRDDRTRRLWPAMVSGAGRPLSRYRRDHQARSRSPNSLRSSAHSLTTCSSHYGSARAARRASTLAGTGGRGRHRAAFRRRCPSLAGAILTSDNPPRFKRCSDGLGDIASRAGCMSLDRRPCTAGRSTARLSSTPCPPVLAGRPRRPDRRRQHRRRSISSRSRPPFLRRHRSSDLVPRESAAGLAGTGPHRGAPVNEYKVDLGTPRNRRRPQVDIHVAPLPTARPCRGDPAGALHCRQDGPAADPPKRGALGHRAGRMLAHEIKNPLSGIRGAAQLLEPAASPTKTAADPADLRRDRPHRRLVDRMEAFSDERPRERAAGQYPPGARSRARLAHRLRAQGPLRRGLRPVAAAGAGQEDQLIQIFLNLVKNAAEATAERAAARSMITTAFRPGVRLRCRRSKPRRPPLEVRVQDNGPGVPADLRAPVRSVRHHQGQRRGPRPRAGRQDGRRPRRADRMRVAAEPDDLPRPAAEVQRAERPVPDDVGRRQTDAMR